MALYPYRGFTGTSYNPTAVKFDFMLYVMGQCSVVNDTYKCSYDSITFIFFYIFCLHMFSRHYDSTTIGLICLDMA